MTDRVIGFHFDLLVYQWGDGDQQLAVDHAVAFECERFWKIEDRSGRQRPLSKKTRGAQPQALSLRCRVRRDRV